MKPILAALLLALAGTAEARTPDEARRCLQAKDLACAEAAIEALGGPNSRRPEVLALAAETAFHAGRFPEAAELMERAVEGGWQDPWDELDLYRRAARVTADWAEVDDGRMVVRFRPGIDAVMVEDALQTLHLAERHLAPLMGGAPPGPVAVEIYPSGRDFIDASPLSEAAVRTTGVVALSKWSRLLITSPRALGRGYGWQDTLAHEYIHLVVSHHTDDRAPVWLQEAIAKYLDNRWRDGRDRFRLGPRQEGLLREALRTGDLVSFDEMHPSLALLETASRAALAYAQLSTLMQFAFERGGEDVLTRVLPAVRQGADPRLALARAAGFSSFQQMEEAWLQHLRGMRLGGRALSELPTVLDGGDELASDPLLAEREDLARYLRLGDLLLERERPRAALVQYTKARPSDEPPSPLLSNRVARAHLALGDARSARSALQESLKDYPDFPLTHKTLGELHREAGRTADAIAAYRQAAALNPFDPSVQAALAELFEARHDQAAAARHARNVRILRRGGYDDDFTVSNPAGELRPRPLNP